MINMYYDPIMGLQYWFDDIVMVDISCVPDSVNNLDIDKFMDMIKRHGLFIIDSSVENVIKPIQSVFCGIISNF